MINTCFTLSLVSCNSVPAKHHFRTLIQRLNIQVFLMLIFVDRSYAG